MNINQNLFDILRDLYDASPTQGEMDEIKRAVRKDRTIHQHNLYAKMESLSITLFGEMNLEKMEKMKYGQQIRHDVYGDMTLIDKKFGKMESALETVPIPVYIFKYSKYGVEGIVEVDHRMNVHDVTR